MTYRSKMLHCRLKVAIGAVLCLAPSIFMLFLGVRLLISEIVDQHLTLSKTSATFEAFQRLPPGQVKFYFFNITNVTSFDGSQLGSFAFSEVGPYVYDEQREKHNITFEDDRVSYVENVTFTFNQSASWPRTETDQLTLVNYIHGLKKILLKFAIAIIENASNNSEIEQPYLNDNVGNILFNGMSILNPLHNIQPNTPTSFFGNNVNPRLTVDTGRGNVKNILQLLRWNNKSTFSNVYTNGKPWKDNGECNLLKGTDGTLNGPGLSGDEKLIIYNAHMCRDFVLHHGQMENGFDSYQSNEGGITRLRYVLDSANFEPQSELDCYCVEACVKGMINLRNCLPSPISIMASPPYFFTHPSWRAKTGLDRLWETKSMTSVDTEDNNNQKYWFKYGSFAEIEPITGISVSGVRRMQLNVKILNQTLPIWNFTDEYAIAPLFWIEENGSIDEANLDRLRQVYKLQHWITVACIILFTVGLFLLVVFFFLMIQAGLDSLTYAFKHRA